jgi:hypothetical protein
MHVFFTRYCIILIAPTSCEDILKNDRTKRDGVYTIYIDGQDKEVFCDMTTQGGGWTVRFYVFLCSPKILNSFYPFYKHACMIIVVIEVSAGGLLVPKKSLQPSS